MGDSRKARVVSEDEPIPFRHGRIALDSSYDAATWGVIPEKSWVGVWIGETVLGVPWGAAVIEVPAGTHLVRVRAAGAAIQGSASWEVDVADGQTVRVYYRLPSEPEGKATLGNVRPRSAGSPGESQLVGLLVLLALLLFTMVGAALASAFR